MPSTLLFRGFLASMGIDEAMFVKKARATYKLGILFRNWRNGTDTYVHPFNNFNRSSCITPLNERFDFAHVAAVANLTLGHPREHLQSALMQERMSPYFHLPGDNALKTIENVGQCGFKDTDSVAGWGYSFHFDGKEIGRLLRERAIDLGVQSIEGTIERVVVDPEKNVVSSLCLTDGRMLAGDMFIDCSGFRRLLVGGSLGGEWVSYGSHLICDTAIPFMLPHADDGEIEPFTEATALSAGWMWRIPTGDRLGCGYTFSGSFCDPDAAHRELEAHLGRPIEPIRTISFDPGRLSASWIGNTVAVGLASKFSEPLEATSIHCTLLQMHLLVCVLTPTINLSTDVIRDQYNRQTNQILDEVRDFLIIHYLSEREDTAFWRHLKNTDILTDRLRQHLDLWRHKIVEDLDFESYNRFPTFGALPYMYVLDGLGRLDRDLARRTVDRWGLSETAQWTAAIRAETVEHLLPHAVKHGELIRSLNV